MLQAEFRKYVLHFNRPSGTSRGVLKIKESWFIFIKDSNHLDIVGIGECGLLKGLSIDDLDTYETVLAEICENINDYQSWDKNKFSHYPSIRFGLEMALMDLKNGGKRHFFANDFLWKEQPIPINGLVWMGEKQFMFEQIQAKIEAGFDCLKLKIGAINFDDELDLLKYIRQHFSSKDLELRVDANGAFKPEDALSKLNQLATFDIHSIEQPIRQGQWQEMAKLCSISPIDIAMDEELIGVLNPEKQIALVETIQPKYLIFKPSLLGGFQATQDWIDLCDENGIGWWVTSALESNIGLNAIAQWTAELNSNMLQGLGTGQVYSNNFDSPLKMEKGSIVYKRNATWNLSRLYE